MPNAEFCASCGAPVSALPSQGAPAAPTKRRSWFWVIAVVMMILAFMSGASIAPERGFTVTTTYVSTSTFTKLVTTAPTVATSSVQRVKIGQTFTVLGKDKVPCEVTFTKVRYDTKVSWNTADKNYKFVIVEVAVKNLGNTETTVFGSVLGSYGWTVKVDKGYVYKVEGDTLPGYLRPEEIKTGYVYFEILQDTAATEMQARLTYPSFDLIVEL